MCPPEYMTTSTVATNNHQLHMHGMHSHAQTLNIAGKDMFVYLMSVLLSSFTSILEYIGDPSSLH